MSCRSRWSAKSGRGAEESEHQLFAFLTTAANDTVRPIHAKAMPVILTSEADCEIWLTGTDEDALALQTPAPDDLLWIVAKGSKTDSVAA